MLIGIAAAAVAALMPAHASSQPPTALTPGTISIASAADAGVTVETRRVFEDAVQRAMLRAQFTPLPGQNHGRYSARVVVTRTSRGTVASRIPGGAAPLASLNGSVSLSLPPGGDRLSDLIVTELTVVISRRSDAQKVWSGSAVTARVSGTPAGAVDLVARTLADAVMGQFPGQAAGPVSIP